MDFARAFTYPFQDPDWIKKIAIIALVSLIPVVGWFVLFGWSLDATRRAILRDTTLLPNLAFGAQLGHGLKGLVVGLVYTIPVLLFYLPIMIVTIVAANGSIDADTAGYLITGVSICCGGLIFIYAILLAVMLPAAYANYVAQGKISAGLKFGEVFGLLRSAPGAWLFVVLGSLIGSFIASAGSVICVIGVLLTTAYYLAVMGNLYGQAYLESMRNQAYR